MKIPPSLRMAKSLQQTKITWYFYTEQNFRLNIVELCSQHNHDWMLVEKLGPILLFLTAYLFI